jgi:hypothetical protein
MSKPNGYIIYEGPSQLAGQADVPIVAILTLDSANPKTGPMHQLWILRSDMPPTDAIYSGADGGICGDCALRGTPGGHDRECYVNVAFAPSAVYRTYKRGLYPTWDMGWADRAEAWPFASDGSTAKWALRLPIRLGAYGDPAAVPPAALRMLVRYTSGYTGFTHAWRTCDPSLKTLLMASVETPAQAREAHLLGWRTARAAPSTDTSHWEIVCPATEEAGKRTTCDRCQLCNGTSDRDKIHLRKHIVFPAHGSLVKARGRLINIS